jgi:ribonuclease R
LIEYEQLVKLIGAAGRWVGVKEILRAGGFNPGEQTALKRALRELVKAGRLAQDGKRFGVPDTRGPRAGPAWQGKTPAGARALAQVKPMTGSTREDRPAPKGPPKTRPTRGKTIEGTIHHHRDGFAFVKPVVGQTGEEDVFIPPEEARRALDHDRVRVEVVPGRGGRTMGRIVEVTSRTRQLVVGTYCEDRRGAWVEPREAELGPIRVPPTQLARPGDAVKVRLGAGEALFEAHDRLTGEVAGSLGSQDDHSVEVLSVAFAKGFHDEFPPEVMDEADAFPVDVTEADARSEHRRDVRALPLVTIDGEDARDFDDAIFVEDHARGWRLVVAIADVAHYVQEKTALDAEALRRATSVYLPSRVLPMLPERLSNGLCSLRPDVDRLCMVADMLIDRQGHTLGAELYPAVMRSHARCTYTEVHQVLNGEHVPHRAAFAPLFQRANALAQTLTAMRVARGAIDFDLPERRVELDDKGLPVRMVQRERWESHRLVEECMLAANEAVARHFREKGLPTVNRYHGLPDEERLATFLGLLGAYGVEVKATDGALTSKELNGVLKRLAGHAEQRALHQLALRSMMQAVYSSKESGHYGLGAEDYLHFTSPIRRYPDLLVHRLLKHSWSKKRKHSGHHLEQELERLEALAVQSSERERAAMQVEREVSQLYSCLLVRGRVGESFDGTVSGLSENGFYVELDELHVDGFVRGETVFPDFEFDQATYRLNFGNGHVVKVGQKARVTLVSVNLQRKQIDLVAESLEDAPVARNQGRSKPAKSGATRGGRAEKSSRRGGERREERSARGSGRTGPGQREDRRGGRERPPHGAGASPSSREEHARSSGSSSGAEDRLAAWRAREASSGRAAPRPERGGTGGRSSDRRGERGASSRSRQGGEARLERLRRGQPSSGRAPQPQRWEAAREEAPASPRREEESSGGEKPATGFDARSVLDRLWRERGGKGGGRGR